ncbi:MAG: squalene/phytoene synthase family protein [Nitrospira sp.]|nr:squalene/phytoene synthase family protein [Nitrospira sp.]
MTSTDLSKQELLRDLLKQVSRLFYTTLAVVPADVRDQVSLAYLFARAADTIADTDLIDRHRRLDFLSQLKSQFVGDQIVWGQVQDIQRAIGPLQQHSAERVLLERLDQCFRLFLDFSPEDRRRVQRLMTTLTQGMEMDLSTFPPVPDPFRVDDDTGSHFAMVEASGLVGADGPFEVQPFRFTLEMGVELFGSQVRAATARIILGALVGADKDMTLEWRHRQWC